MRIQDLDSETFGQLQNWIYLHDLNFDGKGEPETKHLMLLSKVWKLGDKYLMAELQNEAIHYIHQLISDQSLDSPVDLEEFINHAFCTTELSDEDGQQNNIKIDIKDLNMVQRLIVHKFALGEWGIGEAELRQWIIGGHLSYPILGAVTLFLNKCTLDGSLEDERTSSWESDYYYLEQK